MPKITIFTTTTCAYCHMLKEYLKGKNIAYEEKLVDTDPNGPKELIDTCGSMGVPCTHITLEDGREEKILGFDRLKIDEMLGLK